MRKKLPYLLIITGIILIECTPKVKEKPSVENKDEGKTVTEFEKDLSDYNSIINDFNIKNDIYRFIKYEKSENNIELIISKMSEIIDKISKNNNDESLINSYWKLSKQYEEILTKEYKKEEIKNTHIKTIENIIKEYSHKENTLRIRIGMLKSRINDNNEIDFEYANTLLDYTINSIKNFEEQKNVLLNLSKNGFIWIPKESKSFEECMENKKNYLVYIEDQFKTVAKSL
ncbi:MAG TPA: hypothetical protein PKW55_06870 [Spirochaetota bacterium]|nr:hypothetical protein [Spirochaetota bacterium]HOM38763.1 hypothetical protein [Spirochaetota bacterium]HPQ49561.1 hypothetical protein [Spirochaetota bacterium]